MNLIHWWSAERRLEACERTIIALGGSRFSDHGVPSQLAAQREMIKYEIKYYKEQTGYFFLLSVIILFLSAVIVSLLFKFGVL